MKYATLAGVMAELNQCEPFDEERLEQVDRVVGEAEKLIDEALTKGGYIAPDEPAIGDRVLQSFANVGAAGIMSGSAYLEKVFTENLDRLAAGKITLVGYDRKPAPAKKKAKAKGKPVIVPIQLDSQGRRHAG